MEDSEDHENMVVIDTSADALDDAETVTGRVVADIELSLTLDVCATIEIVEAVEADEMNEIAAEIEVDVGTETVGSETVVGRVTTPVIVDCRVLRIVVIVSDMLLDCMVVDCHGSVKAPPSLASERVEVELAVGVMPGLSVSDPVSEPCALDAIAVILEDASVEASSPVLDGSKYVLVEATVSVKDEGVGEVDDKGADKSEDN